MRSRQTNWIMFLIQPAAVCVALVLAWLLRFDFALPHGRVLLSVMPIFALIRWAVLYAYQLTHGHWRYTEIGDLKDLLSSVLLGSIILFGVLHWVAGFLWFPRSIYFLEAMLTFLLLAGLRVGVRILLQARESARAGVRIPVLIVGAGSATAELLPILGRKGYHAVGLVDDDPAKQRTKFCGVPVLGRIDQLPALAHRHKVCEILIAVPSATGAQMFRITDFCGQAGVPFRAVPELADLVAGKVTISEFREINLDSLLGREPVRMESDTVRARLSGRVVMVTGAAGSIGSELCKQIVRFPLRKLVCVDQAETPLFNLQQHTLAGAKADIVYPVVDITDTERMRHQILEHGVQVIFHAAAYKHVPLVEENPYEGLKNNVFGLLDLVEIAEDSGCEDFLLISSDKAVKPTSILGCTKRLGEMIAGARGRSPMRCVSVRFGNVLGSQGSVIPVFQEQIRTRRCITVTHPAMTRYFMTVPEAVSLVLQAFTVGDHGNILVLDMGKPVRILDVAKILIRMSGKSERDVHIIYTGIRPGEKLYEELFYDSEVRLPTPFPKIMRAQGQLPSWPSLMRSLQELRVIAYGYRADLIRAKIKQIIPEYQGKPILEPDHARAAELAARQIQPQIDLRDQSGLV
jgi:FlaA1/EpsC-like NDP-sugar epimerase